MIHDDYGRKRYGKKENQRRKVNWAAGGAVGGYFLLDYKAD